MQSANNFIVLNIREYLEHNDKKLGEDKLTQLLSEFLCHEHDTDVGRFLKEQAIEFAKKHQAVTYLVLSSEDAELLGFFSITVKPLVIKAEPFSKTVRQKLARFSKIDENEQTYNLAAYLIAQLGRNFSNNAKDKITGKELLEIAIRQIQSLQYQIGGMVVFVETKKDEKLLSFYKNYGFKPFGTRQVDSDPHEFIQLLRLI